MDQHPATTPGRAPLLRAITAAQRAPSVQNTQPWRWRLRPRAVQLWGDPARALPAADPDRRDLLLSCGAVLHHLVVVLRQAGWVAEVDRFPAPHRPWLLAELRLQAGSAGPEDRDLGAAVTRRCTDRRAYAPWPLPGGQAAVLTAAAAVHGVHLDVLESGADRVIAQPAGFAAAQAPTRPPDRDGARLAVLSTHFDGVTEHLRAGEALSAVLLHATVAGLATHTVSEVLEVPAARSRLAAALPGGALVPQVVVRVGQLPAGSPPLARTWRRSVAETVESWEGEPAR